MFSMTLDKKKIKEDLEKERDVLLEEVRDMGKLNPETGEWEATPMEQDIPEADQNDMADRFADYEEKSSMLRELGSRLNSILRALKGISRESFGKCEVCKKEIEAARMEANPAARTCKEHLNG
ncbi:MAG: TraR/DksA C4-type zinc finger protein [Minisyncoccia bacterium]